MTIKWNWNLLKSRNIFTCELIVHWNGGREGNANEMKWVSFVQWRTGKSANNVNPFEEREWKIENRKCTVVPHLNEIHNNLIDSPMNVQSWPNRKRSSTLLRSIRIKWNCLISHCDSEFCDNNEKQKKKEMDFHFGFCALAKTCSY